jgi:Fe-S cluster biogenesis protein NfuA
MFSFNENSRKKVYYITKITFVMQIERSIEEIILDFRKSLQADGGDIEFMDFRDGIVKVKITRTSVPVTFSTFLRKYRTREGVSCGRCRIPTGTVVAVLEATLKEKISGIKKVEVVK